MEELETSPGIDLVKAASEAPNFMVIIPPWHIVTLPAGYIYLTFRMEETMGIKWNTFNMVGESCGVGQGACLAHRWCSALLEAYPALVKGSPQCVQILKACQAKFGTSTPQSNVPMAILGGGDGGGV
eukprot:8670844-Pyramimonas_sp.AAC.1